MERTEITVSSDPFVRGASTKVAERGLHIRLGFIVTLSRSEASERASTPQTDTRLRGTRRAYSNSRASSETPESFCRIYWTEQEKKKPTSSLNLLLRWKTSCVLQVKMEKLSLAFPGRKCLSPPEVASEVCNFLTAYFTV